VTHDPTHDTSLVDAELPEHLACYVYGIVSASSPGVPEEVTGVDGTAVELIRHEDLAAAVGVITAERPPGRRADLVAHSEVVDALAAAGPVVPVRFGSVAASRRAVVEDLLVPEADRFRHLLAELNGRAQFNLRATYLEPAVLAEIVSENPEVAALRERTRDLSEEESYADRVRLGELVARAMDAKRELDSQVVLDAVLPHSSAYRLRSGTGVNHLLDAVFLVEDDQRASFEETLESLAEGMHERARLRLLGPLAAYDFVEDLWG
jgi:hypothetical protein